MTDKGSHGQEMNKEVQHSKAQAEQLALRGIGQRTLLRSEDRLSDAQAALFMRMRDEGAKICVHAPEVATDPIALNAFLSARLAPGRQLNRTPGPDHKTMTRVCRVSALRSMIGGHIERVTEHTGTAHQYYGLSASGLALLAAHQTAKRKAVPRPAKPTE